MKNKKLISIYSTKTNQFPNIRSDYNANTTLYGQSCIDIKKLECTHILNPIAFIIQEKLHIL